ncbi:MAG: hypothetical protein DWQ35_19940 [Planctomycetota bacterium]|nr:MAG: hypothetical protein DWQ35_19940 [Planctomycetota bacterium]REK28405.1 MAG: hypothetical protein DWQ42_05360 [Planctomycetota bacterium]REK48421.1 MAG: hypothetical protein DWQ46_02510 [Planctomycetota bacterium]
MKEKKGRHPHRCGPFVLNIEGTIHHWPVSTITTEQISELGGWDASLGVIQVDRDCNERTLEPGQVVELVPGLEFGKKVRWKRG